MTEKIQMHNLCSKWMGSSGVSAVCIQAWFHDKWRHSGDGKVQRGTSVLLIILAAAGGWRLTAAALCGWSRRLQTGAAQTDTHQPPPAARGTIPILRAAVIVFPTIT